MEKSGRFVCASDFIQRPLLTCAWQDADAVLLTERLEVKSPAVTGRKGNANKARAGSRNEPFCLEGVAAEATLYPDYT